MKKVIQIFLLIFILLILVLCCSLCVVKNFHPDHKVLEITDEEALKKENLTIENTKNDFDTNVKKLEDLKNLIRKEMQEIDKIFQKVDDELTKSFEMKREKLKTEVTKIKETFENSLRQIENITKTYEKIIKGMKTFEKEEKNMIKTLSYVSKINTNKEKTKSLLQGAMKNLKISFIEEESKIKYEPYIFSGIPFPSNIEFKEIRNNSFKVFWNLDDINILNIDKKEIQFRIEIKQENKKEKFKQIYEGKDNNYFIDNLEKNTTYDIRLCSVYKNETSNWTQTFKVKTKNLDANSVILSEHEKGNEFLKKLFEWTGYKKMELLYRGTRDGSGSNVFHEKCNNQGANIVLCKNDKGNIFGGYASTSWTSSGNWSYGNGSFLFTLTNIHGTEPTQFPNTQYQNYALYHNPNYGPTFGNGHVLYICNNYLNDNSSYCGLGGAYPDVLGRGNSIFSGDANSNNIKIKELEVFKMK